MVGHHGAASDSTGASRLLRPLHDESPRARRRINNTLVNIHYDFLVENQFDCLTWKMFQIPSINKGSVEIGKQENHRLVWLSRVKYTLSNNRGFVKRIDHGTYLNISRTSDSQELKFILNGNILNGLFVIAGNFCQLKNHD